MPVVMGGAWFFLAWWPFSYALVEPAEACAEAVADVACA